MLYNCPFCYHENANLYRGNQKLRGGGYADIFICSECGTLFPHPRMNESESGDYCSTLECNEKIFSSNPTKIINQGVLHHLKKYILPRDDDLNMKAFIESHMEITGNALDIGAFTGRFVYFLKSLGFNAYGLEKNEEASKFARQHDLNVILASFPENIPKDLLQMKFSLISVMEVIYYFVDLKKSLAKINDMLIPGGFILIKCHQGKSRYYNNYKNSFFKRYGDYVQGIPTMNSLRYCLGRSGFEIGGKIMGATHFTFTSKKNKILKAIGGVLSKIYDKLHVETADHLIILAKKRFEVKNV